MRIKEKVENMLYAFLERNSDYIINLYIRNAITANFITMLRIPVDRNVKAEGKNCSVQWKINGLNGNELSLPYDEVMDCYEETDEYNQQIVVVIMKNGMKLEFECCGEC